MAPKRLPGRPRLTIGQVRLATPGRPGLACLALLACARIVHAAPGTEGALHVASPDWRDQVVYFVMIDRFDNGDPGNDDQGAGEFDPASNAHYSGGDLAGVERRVDYIRGLGATAVWITPPVANRWWDPRSQYGGYHGYWAENFVELDRHVGSLADYQRLSRRLHGAGLYLIQDVVVNHTANYFSYGPQRDPADPARDFHPNPEPDGRSGPTQAPFDRNDARDPAQQAQAIYHWTPTIEDIAQRRQELEYQLADLDDLNTRNPVVRAALRRSHGYWIGAAGVDAFRVDTAFHVEPAYFDDFLHATDPEAPGVLASARASGRKAFHVFGEGFGTGRPYEDTQARRINEYLTRPDGSERLPGMINFPLHGGLIEVYARGQPSAQLGHRIRATMALHPRPHLMPTFVDNHDVDRFLAGGDDAGLRQALLAMLTLPGIPTIYYGTEQGFQVQRQAMFAGGYGAGGRDHFDTGAPLYRYLQRAIALRRAHPLFSRGSPTVLRDNAARAGVLAWRMDHAGQSALVVLNSAPGAVLLDGLETGWPAGTRLRGAFAIGGVVPELVVGAGGRLDRELAGRGGWVWIVDGTAAVPQSPRADIVLDPLPARVEAGAATIAGRAAGVRELRLVVDGDLAGAARIVPAADGRFAAALDTAGMLDPGLEHRVVAWAADPGVASAAQRVKVRPHWRELAAVDDPRGDDHGPRGRYRNPTDASWAGGGQLDLRRVAVREADGSLEIEVGLEALDARWNPVHGFDHMALTVYLELPDREDGATVMPLQNDSVPNGMRWHYRSRVSGWTNALHAHEGASATSEGRPVAPAARIEADRERRVVRLVLPATALGRPRSLAGARILVTTWDYDGGYRALQAAADGQRFGGGDGARDPLWMDAVLLEIPR